MVKIIAAYWKNLFLESSRVMWNELGITGTLFGFLFSGIYVLVIREQTFSWEGILLFAKVFIFLIGAAWFLYVVKVSAAQDKKKADKIQELDDERNSFTPNIHVSGEIDVRDVQIGHIADGAYVLSHITNIASAPFANNPKLPNRNNNAKNVRAEIDYLDEGKTTILASIQGRWGGLQPNEINSSDRTVLESTNFPNNNAKRWLDLVMKYPEDEYCYAYSNDSYGQGYFLHPNHIIEKKRFFIHVRLKGEYIRDNIFEFEVVTEGKGDTFIIRNGETWIKTKNSRATKTPQKVKLQKKRKSSQKSPTSKR